MPTYCYRCTECGAEREVVQGIKEDPHSVCPECNSREYRRVPVGATWILKGDGWARDGYKNSTKSRYDP